MTSHHCRLGVAAVAVVGEEVDGGTILDEARERSASAGSSHAPYAPLARVRETSMSVCSAGKGLRPPRGGGKRRRPKHLQEWGNMFYNMGY